MELDELLSRFSYVGKKCKVFSLTKETADYLYYIDSPFTFIKPSIKYIAKENETANKKVKFILFSAPGAVGKSSLAKYLAFKMSALYWNLSKLKIGDNTFVGSLCAAVGPSCFSDAIDSLKSSNAMLIIDSFDEAEMISGRKMLGKFLMDIDSASVASNSPSIILFARTSTAHYIASVCENANISFAHYEIGYFDEAAAKQFVLKNASKSINNTLVNEYFDALKDNNCCEESFIGYAPVLQAISKHISSDRNTMSIINNIKKGATVSVIVNLMQDLLKREQNVVIQALKTRCESKNSTFADWEKIYTPEEQIGRILSFLLFQNSDYSNYKINCLPPKMIVDYQEVLNHQLDQHPFLLCSKDKCYSFVGPAFKDYSLAFGALNKRTSDIAEMFFEESGNQEYLPSTLFFDFYNFLLKDNTACLSHLDMLYKSFSAKMSAGNVAHMNLIESETEYNVFFEGESLSSLIRIKMQPDDVLRLESLSNASIEAPSLKVVLGYESVETRISNSVLNCKQIEWKSNNVAIDVEENVSSIICATEGFKGFPKFDNNVVGELRISAPNISTYYSLIEYQFNFDDTLVNDDIILFAYMVKRILTEFRTHGKDTLAKTADRIDNVVVGSSKPKQKVLNFLKEMGIIYSSDHLYKVDEAKLKSAGISFTSIVTLDPAQYMTLYRNFLN